MDTGFTPGSEPGFDPGWIDAEPAQVYKHDARSRVWRVDAPDGRSFVIKRFEFSPLRQLLGYCLGLHPGQRERRRCGHLQRLGLRVAPIIAAGVCRRGLGIGYWLVTPYLGTSLHNLFYHDGLTDDARRARVLDAVGELTGELIRHRLFNRDHKASNILIDQDDRAWLIDVGAVRRLRGSSDAARMLKNLDDTLAQAGATPQDRVRLGDAAGVKTS
jgi:serine/threonine protein kinase